MNEIAIIALILTTGFLLGALFFGGLWWTTKRGMLSKSPALWFLGSLFIRYGDHHNRILFHLKGSLGKGRLFCLVGFIFARIIIMHFTQVPETRQNP